MASPSLPTNELPARCAKPKGEIKKSEVKLLPDNGGIIASAPPWCDRERSDAARSSGTNCAICTGNEANLGHLKYNNEQAIREITECGKPSSDAG